jgi:hypothetical protein
MGGPARYATWLWLACCAPGLAAFGACAAPYAASGADAGGAPDGSSGQDAAVDAASDGSIEDATSDGCTSCSNDLALNVAPTSGLIATGAAIFWADPAAQSVLQASDLAGSAPTKLATALAVTGDLVTDGATVYFTAVASPTTWTLWRAAVGLAGSAMAIGTYAGAPRGLAVDASYAYVFQAGVGASLTLAAAPLTGGPLEAITQVAPTERGLVFVGGSLLWTQPSDQWVMTIGAATRGVATAAVVQKSAQNGADLLTTAGSGLYWANLNATPASIAWGSASDTTVQSIANTPIAPVSLITDGTTAYWADGIDTVWSARNTLGAGARKLATGLSQPGAIALTASHVVVLERGRGAIVLRPR